eukprot:TRINITY_DN57716_c0_g1_i1.p1 TRINITY_DN57716_c0_g1~~TRINITY_DN57716_c0_g1_i1.p1  ORF type:complete len:361 (-),score=60.98 TRINITY_DN57716_c0_g1_i1:5-1087(-)
MTVNDRHTLIWSCLAVVLSTAACVSIHDSSDTSASDVSGASNLFEIEPASSLEHEHEHEHEQEPRYKSQLMRQEAVHGNDHLNAGSNVRHSSALSDLSRSDTAALLENSIAESRQSQSRAPGEPGILAGWMKELGYCIRKDGSGAYPVRNAPELVNSGLDSPGIKHCADKCKEHPECASFEIEGDPVASPITCKFMGGVHIGDHAPGHYCYLSIKHAESAGALPTPQKKEDEGELDLDLPQGPPGERGPMGLNWKGENATKLFEEKHKAAHNGTNHSNSSKNESLLSEEGEDDEEGSANASSASTSKKKASKLPIVVGVGVLGLAITGLAFFDLRKKWKKRLAAVSGGVAPAEAAPAPAQ